MSVKILKLVTGEEIIAEVMVYNDEIVTVKNTMAIMLQPTQDGYSYGFVPWCPLAGDVKSIARNSVIFEQNPTDDARNAYASMFGGIIAPISSKKLIV
jgi:hypothetical protein